MKNREIFYIADIRLPTEKAHGIQIMEMCSAFAKNNIKATLIIPRRLNPIKDDIFAYYDISKNFSIKKLSCLDFTQLSKISFRLTSISFYISVLIFVIFKNNKFFYTRDEGIALLLHLIGKKVVWEGHTGNKNILIRLLIRLKIKIIVISNGLLELYSKMGVPKNNIIVAPDGADIERFDIDITKNEARIKLGLPIDKKIILYTGHLYFLKGVNTLAEAIKTLDNKYLIIFVGGIYKDVINFRKKYSLYKNIIILGHKPFKEIPLYQKAADILVIPNSAKDDVSKLYTSPMKLFGYMASNRPIIASDLPSIREILDESNSFFFIPDDAVSLASAIDYVLRDQAGAQKRADVALEEVRQYSWKNRAQNILKFIS